MTSRGGSLILALFLVSFAPHVGRGWTAGKAYAIRRYGDGGDSLGGRVARFAPGSGRRTDPVALSPVARLIVPAKHVSGGSSTAISSDGNTVAVGAPGGKAGSAYVFTRPASGWTSTARPAATLFAPNLRRGQQFGNAVAVSQHGGVIVVAACNEQLYIGSSVYVFARPREGWRGVLRPRAVLTDADLPLSAAFGISVAVSGNGLTVMVGNVKPDNGQASGKVYVFSRTGWRWRSTAHAGGMLRDTRGGSLGWSIGINRPGTEAIVGGLPSVAPSYGMLHAHRTAAFGGTAGGEIFTRTGRWWRSTTSPRASVPGSDEPCGASSDLGQSVAMSSSGQTVMVGDGGADVGWLYTSKGTEWPSGLSYGGSYLSYGSCIPGPGANLGYEVAVSGDGSVPLVAGGLGRSIAYLHARPSFGWRSTRAPAFALRLPPGLADPTLSMQNRFAIAARFDMTQTGTTIIAGLPANNMALVYAIPKARTHRLPAAVVQQTFGWPPPPRKSQGRLRLKPLLDGGGPGNQPEGWEQAEVTDIECSRSLPLVPRTL